MSFRLFGFKVVKEDYLENLESEVLEKKAQISEYVKENQSKSEEIHLLRNDICFKDAHIKFLNKRIKETSWIYDLKDAILKSIISSAHGRIGIGTSPIKALEEARDKFANKTEVLTHIDVKI